MRTFEVVHQLGDLEETRGTGWRDPAQIGARWKWTRAELLWGFSWARVADLP